MSADGNFISPELDQLLSEPLISHQDDPASWWKMNMHTAQVSSVVTTRTEIPGMPPPTSVPLDRLFSTAGDIISDHRCRLLPGNAETLIFLKFNRHLLDV